MAGKKQKTNDEKTVVLNDTVSRIEKSFGKGAIMRLGDRKNVRVPAITSGSIGIDHALGVGGFPKGRIIEVFGPESSGKTTLALHLIANVQKQNGVAVLIDAEHSFDPYYANHIGVDLDNLLVSQPDYGEQALTIAEELITSNTVDVVVIDSVAALVPKVELEGSMSDMQVGLQARLMSKALRKLTALTSRTNCILVFINQLREKVGITFGSPETTSGGKALKFYSSVRVDVRRRAQIKDGDRVIGNRTQVSIVKNKVAPPFVKTEFNIMFNVGIDRLGELIELGAMHDVINKSGSWYSFGETRLGQGLNAAKDTLSESKNREMLVEIYHKVRKAVFESQDTSKKYTPVDLPVDELKQSEQVESKPAKKAETIAESDAEKVGGKKANLKVKKNVA